MAMVVVKIGNGWNTISYEDVKKSRYTYLFFLGMFNKKISSLDVTIENNGGFEKDC